MTGIIDVALRAGVAKSTASRALSGSANNSATLSLHPDGTIDVTYGEVLSQDILVGLFDGSHSGRSPGLAVASKPYQ